MKHTIKTLVLVLTAVVLSACGGVHPGNTGPGALNGADGRSQKLASETEILLTGVASNGKTDYIHIRMLPSGRYEQLHFSVTQAGAATVLDESRSECGDYWVQDQQLAFSPKPEAGMLMPYDGTNYGRGFLPVATGHLQSTFYTFTATHTLGRTIGRCNP